MVRRVLACACVLGCASSLSLPARAAEAVPSYQLTPPTPPIASPPTFPRVGGHLALALPIFWIAKNSTVIGSDFVDVGLAPGITVTLDEHWLVDFEFVALIPLKNLPAPVGFLIDPGLLYNFGDFAAGMRVVTQVGAPTNIALMPVILYPLKGMAMGPAAPFVAGGIPIFFRDGVSDGIGANGQPERSFQPSIGLLLEAGIGF